MSDAHPLDPTNELKKRIAEVLKPFGLTMVHGGFAILPGDDQHLSYMTFQLDPRVAFADEEQRKINDALLEIEVGMRGEVQEDRAAQARERALRRARGLLNEGD